MVVKFEKFLPLPEGKLAGDIVTSRQGPRKDGEHNTYRFISQVFLVKRTLYIVI